MKKILSRFCTFAAAAVVAASFTACSSEEGEIFSSKNGEKLGNSYSLKIKAQKGEEGTRALGFSTVEDQGETKNVLTAFWSNGETVGVYDASWNQYKGNLQATEDGSISDQVSAAEGNIITTSSTAEPTQGSTLNFVFPYTSTNTWSYEEQDGTIATIAQKYDYAVATATIQSINGSSIEATDPNPVNFESQQAIVKLTFSGFSATTLKIHDSMGNLVKTASFSGGTETKGDLTLNFGSAVSSCYIAMRGVKGGSTLTFTADYGTNNARVFNYTLKNTALENGKYYELTFVEEDALTVEAAENNTTVSFKNNASGSVECHVFNADGTPKTSVGTDGVVTVPAGQTVQIDVLALGEKILFYGDNSSYTNVSSSSGTSTDGSNILYSHIAVSANSPAYVYGSVMSLVNGLNWASDDNSVLPEGQATFAGLFRNTNGDPTSITNHSEKEIILPATTLRDGCYQQMFYRSGITRAPELPATILEDYCYSRMFYGTSLIESPVLPATELCVGCYNEMFYNCSNLNTVRCLALGYRNTGTTWDYSKCTAGWMEGVSPTGTFYVNNSIDINVISAADYFSTNSQATSYTIPGTNAHISAETFWHNGNTNYSIWWSNTTAGIPGRWSVQPLTTLP